MGELIQGNFGAHDPLLTKRQFAQHPRVRRSTRWVEQQVAKGMPSTLDGARRKFRLGEALAWLENRNRIPVEPTTESEGGEKRNGGKSSARPPAEAESEGNSGEGAQPDASPDEAAPPPPDAA